MKNLGMKHVALVVSAGLCLALPSFAQTQTAAPAPDASTPAAGPDSGTAATGGSLKEVKSACRDKAKAQGLKGKEMKQAMLDCVSKENPAMAGVLKCKMDAKDKGLKAGSDDMKAFMKSCKKNKS